jgi:uncharacterized membrane protein
MRIKLVEVWHSLRSSYWFVPSLMAVATSILAIVLVRVDEATGTDWFDRVPWLVENEPDGAREMLSTIAGSIINVAGVTFSITIAALSLASQQFGPRLISNFMKDRGTQIVLGTFVSTFLYCLLVLRKVRGVDNAEFVPHISVLGALFLAILSVGVLIFFIHHVTRQIQASHIMQHVSKDMFEAIDKIFPQQAGQAPADVDGHKHLDVPMDFESNVAEVSTERNGYIEAFDNDGLVRLAADKDILIKLIARPGDFVVSGAPVFVVYPAARLEPDLANTLRRRFIQGTRRSEEQDVTFLMQQLVEMASRALSTGVNDPFTAVACLDWLTAGLVRAARRPFPSRYRYDDSGNLRVIAESVSFAEMTSVAYDQIRQYGRDSVEIVLRLLQSVQTVGEAVHTRENRQILIRHAQSVYRDGIEHLTNEQDKERLETQFRRTMNVLFVQGSAQDTNVEDAPALVRVPNMT